MARYFFLLLIVTGTSVYALDLPEWHEGAIVLSNETVLKGEIAIHVKQDVVLLRTGESLVVYPAHKVQSVFFYDQKADINRKFVSLVSKTHGYHQYKIYEIVLRGEVMVLRKEKNFSDWNAPTDFKYFVFHDHQLLPIRYFKKKVFPYLIFKDEASVVSFIDHENLNPNALADILRIIQHYNQTEAAQNSLARR